MDTDTCDWTARHLQLPLVMYSKHTHTTDTDESIARQVLRWMPQGHRGRRRPRNTWKRSGEGDVDSRVQVQLQEDGDDSTRQSGWR